MLDPVLLERLPGNRRLSRYHPGQAEALTGARLEVVLGAQKNR